MAKISEQLLALDENLAGESWNNVFLSEGIVVEFLKTTQAEDVQNVLSAGAA